MHRTRIRRTLLATAGAAVCLAAYAAGTTSASPRVHAAGGDLRIGLPLQSLHDGERWVHTPQRLSVWIEAPREAILRVVQRHDTVRRLVEGEWIHLFCIDPQDGELFRCIVDETGKTAWVPERAAH